jgi:hypothetical protein
MTVKTKEYEVTIKFVTETYEDALILAKNNLSKNAIEVARIHEVSPEFRFMSELISNMLNDDVEPVPLPEVSDGD